MKTNIKFVYFLILALIFNLSYLEAIDDFIVITLKNDSSKVINIQNLDSITFSKVPSSIYEKKYEKTIYPNPATNFTKIEFLSENDSKININIFDINGILKFQQDNFLVQKGLNTFTWNLIDNKGTKLNQGLYYCNFTINKQSYNYKIIIMNQD